MNPRNWIRTMVHFPIFFFPVILRDFPQTARLIFAFALVIVTSWMNVIFLSSREFLLKGTHDGFSTVMKETFAFPERKEVTSFSFFNDRVVY